jgi:hypothetical protein
VRDDGARLEQDGAVRESHRLEIREQRTVGGSGEREEESIAFRGAQRFAWGHDGVSSVGVNAPHGRAYSARGDARCRKMDE